MPKTEIGFGANSAADRSAARIIPGFSPVLFEHRFETRTRGLVCGPSMLVSERPVTTPILRTRRNELFIGEPVIAAIWRPYVLTFKVVVRAREGGEIIWQRPFATKEEAALTYLKLIGFDFERRRNEPVTLPTVGYDGDVEIIYASVATYNSTNTDNTHDWLHGGNLTPAGVYKTNFLAVAGGGAGGGGSAGGGGGAGGMLSGSNFTVTPGASNTITVGTGGTGVSGSNGGNGTNSVFSSNTAIGGGGGGKGQGTSAPGNGGSGGGAGGEFAASSYSGGTGTASQGNDGGSSTNVANYGAGGGGGASAVGQNGTTVKSGDGGAGTSSSISGVATNYAGGGGGGQGASGETAGAGGIGGGAAGATAGNGNAGTANTGGGGGGSQTASTGTGGQGGSGVDILSFTALFFQFFNNTDVEAARIVVEYNRPAPVAYH